MKAISATFGTGCLLLLLAAFGLAGIEMQWFDAGNPVIKTVAPYWPIVFTIAIANGFLSTIAFRLSKKCADACRPRESSRDAVT